MATSMQSHKSEVSTALDFTNLPPIIVELQVFELNLVVGFLAWPLECFGPGVISEPIANEIRVALCSQCQRSTVGLNVAR